MAVSRLGGQVGEDRHLAALDLLDDREEQFAPRAEVVQQHSVAGADRFGDLAQRAVADPGPRELRDQRVEQLAAPVAVRRPGHRFVGAARCGP